MIWKKLSIYNEENIPLKLILIHFWHLKEKSLLSFWVLVSIWMKWWIFLWAINLPELRLNSSKSHKQVIVPTNRFSLTLIIMNLSWRYFAFNRIIVQVLDFFQLQTKQFPFWWKLIEPESTSTRLKLPTRLQSSIIEPLVTITKLSGACIVKLTTVKTRSGQFMWLKS